MNALCAGACFDNKARRDCSRTIEVDDVYAAREELILSRRTHLDRLAHKLEEERVRRVVEPTLSGGDARHQVRDLEYLRDLGLLAPDSPPRIANPIYREAAPQLILQSYLHRVVNSDGRIEREYGLGRGRTDLLVLWPREPEQPSDLWERFVVECKVLRDSDRKSLAGVIEEGVKQTLRYMEQCGAEEGHLVVMDRRSGERRRDEGAEDRRDGDGEADGSGRRRDVRGVVVWML